MKYLFCLLVLLSSLCPVLAEDDASMLYLKNCSACHGLNMQGGNAQSLLDGQWLFAKDRTAILRAIRDGIVMLGMPAHNNLSTSQIGELADLILQKEKEHKDFPLKAELPPKSLLKTVQTSDYNLKVQQWVTGLKMPWAICFPDPVTVLITERPGKLRIVINGKLDPRPIANTPQVWAQGQGGLLDVNIDPDYAQNKWVYLSYSHKIKPKGKTLGMTRIVRGKIVDHQWTDQQVLFEAPHQFYSPTKHHYGSRIVFPPDGYLYFSTGDRGYQNQAQDITRPNGKIHRINRDGSIPKDNPFINTPNAIPSIFTFGNRNPQGLSVHPVTGKVWGAEHGPKGGDELNLIQKAGNYGWPEVTFGVNYNGTPITSFTTMKGMIDPVIHWTPSIAVCGIAFYNGSLFPQWANHLIVASLKDQDVRIVKMTDDKVTNQEIIIQKMGRVRDVGVSLDGAIYIVTNNPDRVLRLIPGTQQQSVD